MLWFTNTLQKEKRLTASLTYFCITKAVDVILGIAIFYLASIHKDLIIAQFHYMTKVSSFNITISNIDIYITILGLYYSLTWVIDLFDGITYRVKTKLCFQQFFGQVLFLPHQFVASFPTNYGAVAGSPFSDDPTTGIDGVVLPNCRPMWYYFFVNFSCLLHICLCSQVSVFIFIDLLLF